MEKINKKVDFFEKMGIKEGIENVYCVIPSEEKRSRGIPFNQIIWSKLF